MHLKYRVVENIAAFIIVYQDAEVVEPGRHARLRGVWGNPCGFKSRLRHHYLSCQTKSLALQLRKLKANAYLSGRTDAVYPAKWAEGAKTLKPSEKMVGRVAEALK